MILRMGCVTLLSYIGRVEKDELTGGVPSAQLCHTQVQGVLGADCLIGCNLPLMLVSPRAYWDWGTLTRLRSPLISIYNLSDTDNITIRNAGSLPLLCMRTSTGRAVTAAIDGRVQNCSLRDKMVSGDSQLPASASFVLLHTAATALVQHSDGLAPLVWPPNATVLRVR